MPPNAPNPRRLVLVLGVLLTVAIAAALAFSADARHLLVHGRLPAPPPATHPLVGDYRPDGTELATCERMPDERSQPRQSCRARAMGNIAYERGPHHAFKLLRRYVDRDPGWASDSHISAHFIGAAALARRDGDAAVAFSEGNSLGGGGYYHGLMVQLLGQGDGRSMDALVRETCQQPSIAAIAYNRIKCYHGAGHGFLVLAGHDLPRALELCERSAATPGETNNCAHGVFMENLGELYGLTAPGFRSKWLNENDLEYPCTHVAERHRPFCYSHVASRAGPVLDWNWRRLGELCHTLPRRMNRDACFQAIGLWTTAKTDGDAEDVLGACREAMAPQAVCLGGAVKTIVNDDPRSEKAVARAHGMCTASVVEESCVRAIGTILKKLEPDVHRASCASLGTPFMEACLAGEDGPEVSDPEQLGA